MRGGANTSISRIPSPAMPCEVWITPAGMISVEGAANLQVRIRPPVPAIWRPGHAQVMDPLAFEPHRALLEVGVRMWRELCFITRLQKARIRNHHQLARAKTHQPAACIGLKRGITPQTIATHRRRPWLGFRYFRCTIGIGRGIGGFCANASSDVICWTTRPG